ncbi:hypothetical protein TTHERM_00701120 (macronuclear) [Tetrahymena thermophila SB210]|uniref:Transmembrane protein n=1 Tax=Tetrahymena thermophila (strain SB210) TaxID=312017 RepID=Q22LN7_TETTS|nr:hypothetical protein TTHERM_00701120 [Tetrahymena thermophila SB210]EAR86229.1 hypothetical protein TTHERM_00701120 [Tetrahymena thermophila SB210]|eukprot:XP_976824.1 hypothetical protein TTHERM_00701120 [Tetrahymena thermophila SB210]
MRNLVLITLICFCYGSNNFRKNSKENLDTSKQCQKPCLNYIDKILPAATIGFNSGQNGFTFQSFDDKNLLNLCCDQQKTYDFLKGLIVPDYTDVKQLKIQDSNEISVTITPSDKIAKYYIQVHQQFKRVALQLEANNQLQANVTYILSTLYEPNRCDYTINFFEKNWFSVFSKLGKQVLTQTQVGAQFEVYFLFYTNSTYTQEQVATIYKNYIDHNNVFTVYKAFDADPQNYGIIDVTSQGIHLKDCKNFQDYLKKIGPTNYIQIETNQNIPNFKAIDSFLVFDKESNEIKQCSYEAWNYVFNRHSKQIF